MVSIFMKKKFNKKLYLIFVLLILVIVLIISCEKFNILGPTYIPPETDFRLPEETIPGHIDVNPVPATKMVKYLEPLEGSLDIKANGIY